MSRSLAEINQERARTRSKVHDLTAEAETLAERVRAESDGKFTDGQSERASRLATGIDNAKKDLDLLDEEARDAIRAYADDPRHLEAVDTESDRPVRAAPTGHTAAIRSRALRAVEHHQRSNVLAPASADRLDAVIRDDETDPGALGAQYLAAVADPAYERAFWAILREPSTAHLTMTPAELQSIRTVRQADALRAMSLTGASGGFAVPFTIDPTIINTGAGSINPLREISRVVTIAGDEWRGVTSAGITTAYAAEATETTDNAPTLVQPTVSTEKAQAFVPFSIEIGMDWPTIQQELGALLQESKDDLESLKFTVGNGTNEPFGVITGATTTVNATAAGVFDAEDVYRLTDALPPRHQARATYVASGTIINKMAQFETAGGALQFPEVRDGRLLRKPLAENSSMATVTTVGALFLIYGNFSRFLIVDRIGLQVEFIQHLFGTNHRPTGQRGLFAYWRNGSKVLDAGAFRVLIGLA